MLMFRILFYGDVFMEFFLSHLLITNNELN